MSPQYTSQELSSQLTAHMEELAKANDDAGICGALSVYLEMCEKGVRGRALQAVHIEYL